MAQPVRCEVLVSGWLACKASRNFPTVCQSCQETYTFRNLRNHWPVFIIWMYMMYPPKLQVMLNFEKWSRFMSFPWRKKMVPITLQFWTSTNRLVDIFFFNHLHYHYFKKWIGLHSLKLTKTPLKNGWLGNYLPFGFWPIFQRRAFWGRFSWILWMFLSLVRKVCACKFVSSTFSCWLLASAHNGLLHNGYRGKMTYT